MDNDLNVFIVDDSSSDIVLLKKYISKSLPNAVYVTADGMQTFTEKLEWANPDIFISDYNMPDCNGLEILLLVKEKFPNTPFVFVTGMLNDEEKTAEAILKGAQGYLLKSNISLSGEFITKVLENHKTINALIEERAQTIDSIKLNFNKLFELFKGQNDKQIIVDQFLKLESLISKI